MSATFEPAVVARFGPIKDDSYVERSAAATPSSSPCGRAHPDRAAHRAARRARLRQDRSTPGARYAHRWQPNDVLVWDNVAGQHRASGDFAVGEPRRFWRYLVVGL